MTQPALNEAAAHIENQHDTLSSSKRTAAVLDEEQSVVAGERKPDEPPDGGYGWVCVICCCLINVNINFALSRIFSLHNWGEPGDLSHDGESRAFSYNTVPGSKKDLLTWNFSDAHLGDQ